MTIRSILLHMGATESSLPRLALASELAERLDATVNALFAAIPVALQQIHTFGDASALVYLNAQQLDTERRDRARRIFDAAKAGPRVSWSELNDPTPVASFVSAALTADLLMLGQRDRSEAGEKDLPPTFVQDVIIGSGKPALVIPSAGSFPTLGRTAMVAWKPTRESARALGAALPLLRMADQVHVASWGDDPRQVERWLLRHGIDPVFHHESKAPPEVGDYILSRAADLGADLLVTGCYGHSRTRELVLGGATRTLLDSMTLPVLMAH